MKKVLITGENGYIGNSVKAYILKNYPEECSFDFISLRGGDWKGKSFSEYDAIFHAAGIAHRKETKENARSYYEINRDLAVEVAVKAKEEGVKQFIFLSSMSVYGLLTGRITEETPLKPKTHYGKSKLEAEDKIRILNGENFKVCILRPPMIYGKGCKGNYLTLRKLALKLKIFPYVKNERSMLYIENLCVFVRLMILNEESGLYFPQNGEYVNTSQTVKEIAFAHGKEIRLVKGFGWAVKLMGVSVSLAKKAFGTLTYDKTMSQYKEDYNVRDFNASVKETEL